MGADGEAMSLVAQALQVIKHWAFLIEPERRLAGDMEMLVTSIAFGAFGNRHQRDAFDAKIGKHLASDGELPRPAVDQSDIGALGPNIAGDILVLFHQAGKAA